MHDVVGEFLEDPEVAYTQHFTMPFDDQQNNYWEQYISAFTCMIYTQGIGVSVAYGDCAPLVGHNAFLRWSAVRKVSLLLSMCACADAPTQRALMCGAALHDSTTGLYNSVSRVLESF